MNHLQSCWESYRQTLPSEAPEEQIFEAKLGFYSGALSLLSLMTNKAKDESVTTSDSSKFLDEIEQELINFMSESVIDLLKEEAEHAR